MAKVMKVFEGVKTSRELKMYTVLGATGNIGSVITRILLEKGEKVRVVGRNADRLQQFVQRGAEAVVGNIADEAVMTEALSGVRAAFLMLPPDATSRDYRAEQERMGDSISAAVKKSALQYAVNLSSFGAHTPSGAGPICGLHGVEKRLNSIEKLNVLHLRAGYFFENHLTSINMMQMMGLMGGALKGNLKMPQIATRDIGTFAAARLLKLDFNAKHTHELLGERDLSQNEVAAVIGNALGNPDFRYVQFPYDQVEQVLLQMGTPPKTAACFTEMFQGINDGIVVARETRNADNTTATSIERFVREVFLPAYHSKAVSA
jgi:uncharacterized protein YbjT (DUF2867 family)